MCLRLVMVTYLFQIDFFVTLIYQLTSTSYTVNAYLRNKLWKPECVGSFNMDWQILVFYPEPEARDKIY